MNSPTAGRKTSDPSVAVNQESVQCRSTTVEIDNTLAIGGASQPQAQTKRVITQEDMSPTASSPGQMADVQVAGGTSEDVTENELLDVAIPPSEENIFMSSSSSSSSAAAAALASNSIIVTSSTTPSAQPQLDNLNIIPQIQEDGDGEDDEEVGGGGGGTVQSRLQQLESPSDIISEEAIRQTMKLIDDDLSDTGMGPGRIRRFANQDPDTDEWRAHEKHFFILSSAGKPIYSRFGDESKLSTFMGVIQAIISVYQDQDDQIRSIYACDYRMVFLVRGPLYFVVAARTGEPEVALRDELLWLYHQIISIITNAQLYKIFEKHRNYDLRRLLGGTESFLDHLCSTVGSKPGYVLGAINSLKMDSQVRNAVGNALQHSKAFAKDGLLYGMLIVGESLVTLVRPKKHSFHPSDLHLILNMVNSSTSFRSVPESWMPICLPKFNDRGFLHAYVSYIIPNYPPPANDLCLVLICNNRDNFFKMSECKKLIVDQLTTSGSLFLLQECIRNSSFSVDELNIPGLRHFLFKSKGNIQYTMPTLGYPYNSPEEQKRLFMLYQRVRNLMYKKNRVLKICHYVTKYESIFAWITPTFELYANFSPLVTKPNVTHSVNSLLRWIKKEEEFLFVTKAPTF